MVEVVSGAETGGREWSSDLETTDWSGTIDGCVIVGLLVSGAGTSGRESCCDVGNTCGLDITVGVVSGDVPGGEPDSCVTVGSGRSVTCAGKKASGGKIFLSCGNIPVALKPAMIFSGVMAFG